MIFIMINKFTALIVAAGKGERFGGDTPKQYLPLLGKSVLQWSVDAFKNHTRISEVFVVTHPDHGSFYPGGIRGGATRQESVRLGLEEIARRSKPDFVLIHDAARPCLSPQLISDICNALLQHDAVAPGLPVTDTVKRLSGTKIMTEDRNGLYTVQTPQGFRFDKILGLHREHAGNAVTDDTSLFDDVKIIPGDRANVKITQEEDFAIVEKALSDARSDVRTGKGYDVHRLIDPLHAFQKLKLCGVEIPHDKVLEGHSDADVALHALTDALLATICDGDIGTHFSPKNPQWKGADSAQFLRRAAELIARQDGLISHVDVTIICEEPKIGPHRDKMRARIGGLLDLPLSRISVKATTTEGLGFTGRKEGIAAEAVATVRLPFGASKAANICETKKWGT